MLVELIKGALNKEYSKELRSVLDATSKEFKSCGIAPQGQCIPFKEQRAELKAEAVKGVEVLNLESEIYNTSILHNAGAKFHFGIKGDVNIPSAENINVQWYGETDEATESNTTFTEQRITAHRLATSVTVSKLFVTQTSNAEQQLCNMIAEAINQKLEQTIFSTTQTNNAVKQLLSTLATTITDYSMLCDMEEQTADIITPTYILSKTAKTKLRQMTKENNTNVMDNGTIDGTKVITSSNVEDGYLLYGDFSKLNVAIWGNGIDITIDPITLAKEGNIRLLIGFYVDYYVSNDNAITFAKV